MSGRGDYEDLSPSDAAGNVTNTLPGSVSGAVVQAGSISAVHVHSHTSNVVVPAQLPAPPPVWSGRERELSLLQRSVLGDSAVSLVVLSGAGGVGKTALALRWLHSVRDSFGDGQLYVDLGAFSSTGPVPTSTVLSWFLEALGVDKASIPTDPVQRAALFRSVTARRSLAILLDNAATAAQVRPLIPAAGDSLVVVTSRRRLTGLITLGATTIELGPLTAAQATDLLARTVGRERFAAEPEAVREIATVCSGMPIALSVAGARLRARPRRSVAREARAYRDRRAVLRLGADEGDGRSVRAVFDESFDSLAPSSAGVYLVAAQHPGGTFAYDPVVEVASDVLGLDHSDVEDSLDELVESSLLVEAADDRLGFHDLVWLDAHTRAERGVAGHPRDTIERRFAEWYLDTAVDADTALHPDRSHLGPRYQSSATSLATFAGKAEGMAWWRTERANLHHVAAQMQRHGWDDLLWQWCEAMWGYFLHFRHYAEFIDLQRAGIEAAHRSQNRGAEARLRSQVGFAYAKSGRYAEAEAHNLIALDLAAECGDRAAEATALAQLGRVARGMDRLDDALDYYRRAADLQAALGITRGVALCRRRQGEVLLQLDRVDEALVELRRAAEVMASIPDPVQHSRALAQIGKLEARRGRVERGIAVLRQALEIISEVNSPYYKAEVLLVLGQVEADRGAAEAASGALRQALDLYTSIGDDRRAEVARSALAALSLPEQR